jgi:uncharacterized protein DUF3108
MKKIILYTTILFTFINSIAQEVPDKPFNPDEKLEYIMYYGWIDGGVGTLSMTEDTLNGQLVWHSVLAAHSIGITDKLYRINDKFESYMDPFNDRPLKSIRDIHEGNYTWYNESLFDHENDTVYSQRSGAVKVPDDCQDIVSAFYKLRVILNNETETGTVIKIESYFADEIFPLYIRYKGIETITTKLGTFECMKFSPVVEVGRVFKTKDDMTMWISNDKNRLPIRMKFDLFVGALKCDLQEYKNVKYPLTSKKTSKK